LENAFPLFGEVGEESLLFAFWFGLQGFLFCFVVLGLELGASWTASALPLSYIPTHTKEGAFDGLIHNFAVESVKMQISLQRQTICEKGHFCLWGKTLHAET
jgi:hypothetical protein